MILFLDDMEWRHSEFSRLAFKRELQVIHARSAAEAIEALGSRKFDQVFLDHDLSEDDIMIVPGEPSKVPTGMDVVRHIVLMPDPPQDVIVHSCNGPARTEMVRQLEESGRIGRVRGIPFTELIQRLR